MLRANRFLNLFARLVLELLICLLDGVGISVRAAPLLPIRGRGLGDVAKAIDLKVSSLLGFVGAGLVYVLRCWG